MMGDKQLSIIIQTSDYAALRDALTGCDPYLSEDTKEIYSEAVYAARDRMISELKKVTKTIQKDGTEHYFEISSVVDPMHFIKLNPVPEHEEYVALIEGGWEKGEFTEGGCLLTNLGIIRRETGYNINPRSIFNLGKEIHKLVQLVSEAAEKDLDNDELERGIVTINTMALAMCVREELRNDLVANALEMYNAKTTTDSEVE